MKTTLPTGYFRFHRNKFLNYQLNRWHSLGFAQKEELKAIGHRIHSFADYVAEFTLAGDRALAENRLKNAATYYRAAEFLIDPKDVAKGPAYDLFLKTFNRAFQSQDFKRFQVPYANGFVSTLRFAARSSAAKGTVLALGGFDSFIEDFYCFWDFLAENGYEVIAFEGPGQGMTHRKHNLPFEHDFEEPVKAILDYFKIEKAAILGLSMGGYWALRAAAFEPRLSKVVAMPPVYDWLELANGFNQWLVHGLLKFPRMMNFMVRAKMSVGTLSHAIRHTLFITQKNEPVDAVRWMLGMNKNHLQSHRITQDVLLLGGQNDAFQPPKLLKKQKEALVNARSVTTRIFTKAEKADQHCQVGNFGLAMKITLQWLESGTLETSYQARFN